MSGSTVRTYSPAQVIVLVSGVPMTGLADGSFVEINPSNDLSTMQVGADGEVARSISSNKTCEVVITLQQTSPSNDVLSGMIEIDSLTGGVLFPISVLDLRGRTVFLASQCWISKRPSITFGQEVGDRAWTLMTGAPSVWFAGGSI